MSSAAVDAALLQEVAQFLYREARLADENRYAEWEALWTDDGLYWVPANSADIDPEQEMSILYDNRSRISVRVKQFLSGKRYSAQPEIMIRRIISNIELLDVNAEEIRVASNAMYFVSGENSDDIWGARNEHLLRRQKGVFMMAYKKVMLVNAHKPLPNMTFLI